MTHYATASNTDAPLDPPCTRDAEISAEIESRAIAEAKAAMFRLRNFREIAEVDGDDTLIEAMHRALDDDDVLLADSLRREAWSRYADDLIAAKAQGIFTPSAAAHEVKRRFQEYEARKFPLRSAGTAPYGAAIPGSLPAGRSTSPQDSAVTPGPADFSSPARRDAA